MKVYLAGPINGKTFEEAATWRDYAARKLRESGIAVYSPLRAKKRLLPTNGEPIIRAYEEHPLTSQSGITTRDRFDVMSCDVVLANFLGATEASCGTAIEFGWADAWRKPVVMVIDGAENPFYHPMMLEIAGYVVRTLDEGIEVVKRILLE